MIYISSNNVRHAFTKSFIPLHYTSPNYTSRHYTRLHVTSSHLNFTQLHFTSLSFRLTPLNFLPLHFTSHHYTSPHLTSLHCPFRWFSLHFYSFHFTPFTVAFLPLFLKILGLQRKSLTPLLTIFDIWNPVKSGELFNSARFVLRGAILSPCI